MLYLTIVSSILLSIFRTKRKKWNLFLGFELPEYCWPRFFRWKYRVDAFEHSLYFVSIVLIKRGWEQIEIYYRKKSDYLLHDTRCTLWRINWFNFIINNITNMTFTQNKFLNKNSKIGSWNIIDIETKNRISIIKYMRDNMKKIKIRRFQTFISNE